MEFGRGIVRGLWGHAVIDFCQLKKRWVFPIAFLLVFEGLFLHLAAEKRGGGADELDIRFGGGRGGILF